jgi:hypothetical protein
MIGFRRATPMKRRTENLKDNRRLVYDERIAELKTELSKRCERIANQILKKPKSELDNSVPVISGGRPESNRRKF